MVRRIALTFFVSLFGTVLLAQTAKDPAAGAPVASAKSADDSAPAATAKASKESTPAATTSSASSQYPLDAIKNFSAIMIGSIAGDDQESHVYRLGHLMRTDVGGSYAVTDLVKGDTYGVAPKGCLHDSHSAYRVFPFDVGGHGRKVERVTSGKETIDGHSCVIEDVTVTAPGPRPRAMKLRFWEAEDLQGFPVKVQLISSFGHDKIIRYKDVSLAPPDAALFKHPTKCDTLAPKDVPLPAAPSPGSKKAPATPPPVSTPPN